MIKEQIIKKYEFLIKTVIVGNLEAKNFFIVFCAKISLQKNIF